MSYKINEQENEYIIKVSTRGNFKYDVYNKEKYIVSFGAKPYGQYKDLLGHYKELDNKDEQKRINFRKRFNKLYEKNKNNILSGIFWSWRYLW